MENNQEKITLTLTAEEEVKEEVVEEKVEETVVPEVRYEDNLTDEEKEMVENFSKQIDITQTNTILQYGSGAQAKVADFSDTALKNIKTKDLDEIGDMMTELISELKGFEIDQEDNGFFGFFKKQGNKIQNMMTRYDEASDNVDKIAKALENHQIVLLKDIAILDQLYEKNLYHFKELTMYILAGKKRIEEIKATELPALLKKAEESGLPEDAQAANDLSSAIDRFEKKIHDLELTRMVAIQMAPQIRLVQNNDTLMTEKIQSTLVNTIPLWKSQMLIALGISHSKEAIKAQNEVSEMTNEMLRKNAETLKMATIETAKESERGIVDMETLTNTNQKLIETLDEVQKIQQEGRERRQNAQLELRKIESELNKKLTDIKGA